MLSIVDFRFTLDSELIDLNSESFNLIKLTLLLVYDQVQVLVTETAQVYSFLLITPMSSGERRSCQLKPKTSWFLPTFGCVSTYDNSELLF